MEKIHAVSCWKGTNLLSPPYLVRWSNTHPGDFASPRCMESLWELKCIFLFPWLLQIFFLQLLINFFPTQFLNPFSLLGVTFWVININIYVIPFYICSKLSSTHLPSLLTVSVICADLSVCFYRLYRSETTPPLLHD